jgi:dipicolinate synthase subunit B
MNELKIGFAMCGSFCTYDRVIDVLRHLSTVYTDITPIMSEKSYITDTRFGDAQDFIRTVEEICGKKVIASVKGAEPIGPKKLLDVLVVAPCTGNTIAKIANGITDSSVTMAVKAHLRNERPVILAVSTNDGLAGNAANIGKLLNVRNIYFVPFGQDDAFKKPRSLVADFNQIESTIEASLHGAQIQPILIRA